MAGVHDRLEGRNGQIWRDYIRKNMTQVELATKYGLSQSRISDILAAVRKEYGQREKADLVVEEIGWLRDVRAEVLAVLDSPPPVMTSGKDGDVVLDPETGEPVRDVSAHLRAADVALRYAARLHAMVGLDEATQLHVTTAQAEAEEAAAAAMGRLALAAGPDDGEDE